MVLYVNVGLFLLFCYIFVQWFYRKNFYLFNYIVLYVENIYIVFVNMYVGVCDRDFFQCFKNDVINCVGIIFWQMLVKGFVDFLYVGGVIDNY